ncbi:MAG: protease modulator HflC [Planctomycetales bacterium]|nr:protease modulator HflC [Planctomycetales bacterium]
MKYFSTLAFIAVFVAVCVLLAGTYTVEEGKQAVVTQFGRPVHYTTDAGLHFKLPFIQKVHLLEQRLLPWDGDPENMQTRDKKRIFVDVWARWRIADGERFYLAAGTEQQGHKFLDDIVDSAVRDVVARNNLIDVVRSTNDPLVYESDELASFSDANRDQVTTGRARIEEEILKVAGQDSMTQYGIELVEVHLKRVKYADLVKTTVYERMRSERLRIAKRFESEAEEERNRILGQTTKELDKIQGETLKQSSEIRGAADAKVIEMTAAAYSKSPEFFEFIQRLKMYEESLVGNTRLIMSTDSDVLQLLNSLPQ